VSGPRVRPATAADLDTVARYNALLAVETESKRLDPEVLRRGVARALGEPDRLRYWIAEVDGRPVGQAAITREWSDWRDGWLWWLQSVYVEPEHRGRGLFRTLFEHIRAEAHTARDVVGLRLYVEVENQRARRVYQAMGLKPGGYVVFEDVWGGGISHPAG
jgi:GNAT superfamily N-acetyltransferase